jgi:hypothetical protein
MIDEDLQRGVEAIRRKERPCFTDGRMGRIRIARECDGSAGSDGDDLES